MSTKTRPRRASKLHAALIVLGAVLVALGVLWFLQGAGVVHVRPILCVSRCKPVNKSVGWVLAGLVACAAGLALGARSARHLRDR